MGGLAELEHHVVGGVDHVVDRPHAGQGEAAGQPAAATGPTATSVSTRAVKRGHRSWSSTTQGGQLAHRRPGARPAGRVGQGEGRPEPGRQVAGHAGHGPGVGAVALHGDVEDDVGLDAKGLGQRLARGGPPATVGRAPAARRGRRRARARRPEHSIPLEITPSSSAGPIAKPPGSTAPTGARGTRSPTEKFQAPQTTSSGPSPASTTTRRIRSAPSMAAISSTRATTTSSEALADVLDPLDHQAEVVEGGGQVRRVALEGGEVAQPATAEPARDPQNCRRKRMSFSIRARMSAISWRIWAQRSMPKPKAKPVHSAGVDADGGEHRRVDHAAAAQLDPPASASRCGSPAPWQMVQVISNSADGSVNGK